MNKGKNKMKKWISILITVIFVFSSTMLVFAAPAPEETTKVRIGTQPWIGYGPWWIAKDQGLFEKYGLEAELVDFIEDKEVNAAFASGDMNAANIATHTALKLFSVGLDLKLVLVEDISTSADAILVSNEISSIADLKGKSVAYEEGTTSDLLLNYALTQSGLSLSDISPVPMPASDAGTTLLSGDVQAAVTYEPYISEILKNNDSIKILYKAEERPGLISDVFVVNAKWAQGNEETVRKLLQVWDEALQYYQENPEDARKIIADAVGSAPEDLVTAFDGVQFFDVNENQKALSGDFLTTIQDVAMVSQSIGLFETIPDFSNLIDASYVD